MAKIERAFWLVLVLLGLNNANAQVTEDWIDQAEKAAVSDRSLPPSIYDLPPDEPKSGLVRRAEICYYWRDDRGMEHFGPLDQIPPQCLPKIDPYLDLRNDSSATND